MSFLFEKPSGVVVEEDAEITNARRGEVRFVTVADFLDEAGGWRYQAKVVPALGQVWHSGFGSFEVLDPLVAD